MAVYRLHCLRKNLSTDIRSFPSQTTPSPLPGGSKRLRKRPHLLRPLNPHPSTLTPPISNVRTCNTSLPLAASTVLLPHHSGLNCHPLKLGTPPSSSKCQVKNPSSTRISASHPCGRAYRSTIRWHSRVKPISLPNEERMLFSRPTRARRVRMASTRFRPGDPPCRRGGGAIDGVESPGYRIRGCAQVGFLVEGDGALEDEVADVAQVGGVRGVAGGGGGGRAQGQMRSQ